MSFPYWWISAEVNDEVYEYLAPLFEEAAASFDPATYKSEIIQQWRAQPETFEDENLSNFSDWEAGKRFNAFNNFFLLDAFHELGKLILADEEGLSIVDPENNARMIITPRKLTVAILWHALGYENAVKLPGILGNMLIRNEDLPKLIAQVNACIDPSDTDNQIHRGLLYAGTNIEEETMLEILAFLPSGLESAFNNGLHFMAFACAQM